MDSNAAVAVPQKGLDAPPGACTAGVDTPDIVLSCSAASDVSSIGAAIWFLPMKSAQRLMRLFV